MNISDSKGKKLLLHIIYFVFVACFMLFGAHLGANITIESKEQLQ